MTITLSSSWLGVDLFTVDLSTGRSQPAAAAGGDAWLSRVARASLSWLKLTVRADGIPVVGSAGPFPLS